MVGCSSLKCKLLLFVVFLAKIMVIMLWWSEVSPVFKFISLGYKLANALVSRLGRVSFEFGTHEKPGFRVLRRAFFPCIV